MSSSSSSSSSSSKATAVASGSNSSSGGSGNSNGSGGSSFNKNTERYFRGPGTATKEQHAQCLRDKESFLDQYKKREKEGTLPKVPADSNYHQSNFGVYGAAAIEVNKYQRGGRLPIFGNPYVQLAYKYNEQAEKAKARGETHKYTYPQFLEREEAKLKKKAAAEAAARQSKSCTCSTFAAATTTTTTSSSSKDKKKK